MLRKSLLNTQVFSLKSKKSTRFWIEERLILHFSHKKSPQSVCFEGLAVLHFFTRLNSFLCISASLNAQKILNSYCKITFLVSICSDV